jgi:hypothetical protein
VTGRGFLGKLKREIKYYRSFMGLRKETGDGPIGFARRWYRIRSLNRRRVEQDFRQFSRPIENENTPKEKLMLIQRVKIIANDWLGTLAGLALYYLLTRCLSDREQRQRAFSSKLPGGSL